MDLALVAPSTDPDGSGPSPSNTVDTAHPNWHPVPMTAAPSGAPLFVATERLGWPPAPRGWRRWIPWETQRQMVYGDRPDEPSATCHLQRDEEETALCGYEWEGLTPVPGSPDWTEPHPEIRCSECSTAAGVLDEDPAGRRYRYQWSDG